MPGSFFTLRNDNALVAASATFSEAITASPTTYGLVAAQATNYAAKHATFAAAVAAIAIKANKNTTLVIAKNEARRVLVLLASDYAKLIDGTPTVTDEQRAAIGLNVRAIPTPATPPGKPSAFKVTLGTAGNLNLSWKNSNATGCVYQIWRKIGAADFEYICGVGAKKYTDSTVAAGTPQVQYQIQAVRSTGASDWAMFIVNLGTSPASTSVTVGEPAKLAA
ncbi:MAG TPA: hypothetical protein PLD59_03055 [Tepidisphaeraceae bacterium]|nr:hypothetical protein [Tepidisphaeraceae bacterium]